MTRSIPRTGENCLLCKSKAENHLVRQLQWVENGDELLSEAISNNYDIKMTDHYVKRSVERCFSDGEIVAAIMDGCVIERRLTERMEVAWLLLSSVKTGRGKYRPIHIAVIIENETILVLTAYDPRSEAWRWDRSFGRRICWCKKNEV